jgi:hypothetical protein
LQLLRSKGWLAILSDHILLAKASHISIAKVKERVNIPYSFNMEDSKKNHTTKCLCIGRGEELDQ